MFQDEARKILVNSIAANIYESLKETGNVQEVLKSVLESDNKSRVAKNLAQAIKESIKGIQLSH